MQNFMKTIISAVQTWTKGKIKDSTADWNENDSSKDSYVKNRTHWEEEVGKNKLIDHNEFAYDYWFLSEDDAQLSLDKAYRVVFNDVEYECSPYSLTEWYDDGIAIGCNTLCGNTEELGHDEPFLIYYTPSDNYGCIAFKNYGAIHTVSLYSIVDGTETTIWDNCEFDVSSWCSWFDTSWGGTIDNEGEKYILVVNGTTYEFTTKYSDDGYYYIGSEPYGNTIIEDYPFGVADWGDDTWFYAYSSDYYDIKVYKLNTVVHKLDSKYLDIPDNLATTDDVQGAIDAANTAQTAANTAQTAANTAQTAAEHVLYGTISGGVVTIAGAVTLEDGKIYTIISSTATTSGASCSLKINGTSYYVYTGINSRTNNGYSAYNVPADKLFYVANVPVPMLYSSAKRAFYTLNKMHEVPVEVSSTVDSKAPEYIYGYYSSNIAHRYKYMRVKSSTTGSDKYFDITVDDSGTITATEVTE